MTTTLMHEQDVETVAELRRVLEDVSYTQLYRLLAPSSLFIREPAHARRVLESCDADEAALLRLFACHQLVPRRALSSSLAVLVERLRALGLVGEERDGLRANDLVIVPALTGYLLTAAPPGAVQGLGPDRARAYLGEDSLTLAAGLPDARRKRVLDLGTGCGIQGLLAVRGAESAVLSDVEERSLELAGLNAALNDVEHDVRIVAGDCYEPVADECFDLIVALPPYVPSIEGIDEEATSGGPDGLGVLRRVLEGAYSHLTPGGELVVYAQLLCRDDEALLATELEELCPGLDTRLALGSWHPLFPYAQELATRRAMTHGENPSELLTALLAGFRKKHVSGICSAFLRLRRPIASTKTSCQAFALPKTALSTYFVARDDITFHEDRSLRSIGMPASPPQILTGPVAALLSAFTGGSSIEDAARRAWGEHSGADRMNLAEHALATTADLERLGLLSRVKR